MAQRVGILNGSNLTRDKDVSAIMDAILNASWVLTGLEVTTNSVSAGRALIKCTRTSTTPNETVWVVFENTSAVTIDTSGTKKVWIAITQANINDSTLNTDPTGVGIGSIQTGADYPADNFVPLATISGGSITDDRDFIKMKDVKRMGMWAWKIIYTDGSGLENELALGSANTTLISQWPTSAPTFGSPTVDINNTTAKTSIATGDKILIYSAADTANRAVTEANLRKYLEINAGFGGTGADGAIGAGALTITGSNNTYIVKNYTSFAPGANTVTITPTGCILHIKVSGNCDLTGTTFSFSGKGGQYGDEVTLWMGTYFWNAVDVAGTTGYRNKGGVARPKLTTTQRSMRSLLGIAPGQPGYRGDGNGNGGNGGGCVILEVAGNLTFSGGTFTFTGTNGGNGSSPSGGGGGGGGGFFLALCAGTITGSPTVTATGGSGGSGSNDVRNAGGGGASCIADGSNGASSTTFATGGAGATGGSLVTNYTWF